MTPPWNKNIDRYLGTFKEIRRTFKTCDAHVHPTEVIYNLCAYEEDPATKGLFGLGASKYRSPSLADLKEGHEEKEANYAAKEYRRILPMMLRRIYSHTGPKVFGDYFDILGIDRALLLPVAPETGSVEEQMAASFRMFGGDDRFRLAGGVPNTVRNEDVASYLEGQIENYGIVAVKIHPNVTGIDLAAPEGKERVEGIIAASDSLHLPVVIHGGRSEILGDAKAHFAEISKLADIDFRASSPVIIAHGGAYGMTPSEIDDAVVPALKKLLGACGNLCIDISGLPEDAIMALVINVEPERVLFGSDALYGNEIVMGMRLLYALERAGMKSDDVLPQILSENAARVFFRKDAGKSFSD